MSTVFIALLRECRYKFPERTGRHLDLPKKLHVYFIVRMRKWISFSADESGSGSEKNKATELRSESGHLLGFRRCNGVGEEEGHSMERVS
jgi:hypothetical protein